MTGTGNCDQGRDCSCEAVQQTCGKCGLPIRRGETGLRYFGTHVAHPEGRCIYLLQAEIELRTKQRDAFHADRDSHQRVALRAMQQRDELLAVVKSVAAWNRKYPSSRIYGYGDIKQIAAEMDAINAEARAAIAKTEASNG